MIINFKCLKSAMEYPKSIAKLHNKEVGNVDQFRYLGDEIKYAEPSTGDAEIDLRITIAENKFFELAKKFTNRRTTLKTRVMILNSIVRSALTYSCQTWNLTQQQKAKINSVYCKMLRRMVNNGFKRKVDTEFSYHYSNEDILQICKTESITDYVSKQQRKYLANIIRKPNSYIVKKLHFNDDKVTKVGRPLRTLEDEVLQNLGISADNFYRDAIKRKL